MRQAQLRTQAMEELMFVCWGMTTFCAPLLYCRSFMSGAPARSVERTHFVLQVTDRSWSTVGYVFVYTVAIVLKARVGVGVRI